jgi:hypothetical protein
MHDEARKIFEELKELKVDPDKETFAVYFQACAASTGFANPIAKKTTEKVAEADEKKEEEVVHNEEEISHMIQDILIVPIDTCTNPKCERTLKEEDIISGMEKSMNSYIVKCNFCECKFVPRFNVFTESGSQVLNGKDGTSFEFLSPATLLKEFTSAFNKKKQKLFKNVRFNIYDLV